LFINTTPLQVIQVVITSFIGMFSISAGMIGYMFRDLNPIVRIICIGCGLMSIHPSVATDVIGVTAFAVIVASQLIANRKGFKAVA